MRALAGCAEFLVIRQHGGRHGVLAMIDQAPGGPVDGQLQVGIRQGAVNFFVEGDRHNPAARQDFGQVHGAHRQGGARQSSLDLHQATGIQADHGFGAGAHDGIDLGARHAAGNLGEFHRERAAETAAFFRRVHLPQLQSAHPGQQAARAVPDAEFAQRVATVVIGNYIFEACAHVLHAGHLQHKLGELPDARRQRIDSAAGFRVIREQIVKMMRDHRSARARRHHHVFGVAEDIQEVPGHLAGFLAIAGVEGRLAAARLIPRKVDLVAEALQDIRHRHANRREELIHDAGDEYRDPLSHEQGL